MRRLWTLLHRWVGLTFGILLLTAAVTGSLLVVARPLDRAFNSDLFKARSTEQAPLPAIVASLRAEFGPSAAFNIRLPLERGDSLQVVISGSWAGTVFLDPSSGRELGRRGAGDGFFNALFELHSTLYGGDRGRAVLAAAALAYVLMLLTGVVLWWPRDAQWKHAFSLRTRARASVLLFDVHRVAGATVGLLVLVSVASGAYMAWRPLAGWVTYLSGQPPPTSPPIVAANERYDGRDLLDTSVRNARANWPGAVVSVVHIPPKSSLPARVRLRLPDDPHPIGMSTVWLEPATGTVRSARRWSELDLGNRLYSVVYPLHTGELFGTFHVALTVATGIALIGLGGSGLWAWARRQIRSHR